MSLPLPTPRLLLRPFTREDARELRSLIADPDVTALAGMPADLQLPGLMEAWIAIQPLLYARRQTLTLAISRRDAPCLLGSISLHLHRRRSGTEGTLGYWLGKPFWGQGYMTEAAAALLVFGFEQLALTSVAADCQPGNRASARVLSKLGLQLEPGSRWYRLAGRRAPVVRYRLNRRDYLALLAEDRLDEEPAPTKTAPLGGRSQ